jgi:uracil-DNA glycosylase
MSTVRIHDSWRQVLENEFASEYFSTLSAFVKREYQEGVVYPPPRAILSALDLCPFDQVKVVILGQDPYHGKGQAMGLSFSVPGGVRLPPSLQNIYKELRDDLKSPLRESGDLTDWATQGVLLLNATLTVRAGQPGSHQKQGWERFTDAVIKKLSNEREHLVFMLWGNYARAKREYIDPGKHLVLEAPHPSPYSAHSGFFGCRHFSKANEYLRAWGRGEIAWYPR